jgi:hypothetical protein
MAKKYVNVNKAKNNWFINWFICNYNKVRNMDNSRMAIYFFMVSFLVAVSLYSASIDATAFRILNPGNTAPLISFYAQLHLFIFYVVAFLLGSIFFMLIRKAGWPAVIYFVLFATGTLYIIALGILTYIIIPLGFT